MNEDMLDESGAHVDLSAVHRDDLFLDELADGYSLPDPTRDEQALSALLYAWCGEIDATPAPAAPTLADVERAIAADEQRRRRAGTSRRLRLIAGAAAIAAVAAAGLLVLSEKSQPGDPLWNVKKVVFAEQAQQTQATVNVQSHLERAEAAIAAGHPDEAAQYLASAQRELAPVHDPAVRDRMTQWIDRLLEVPGTDLSKIPGLPSLSVTTTTSRPQPSGATGTDTDNGNSGESSESAGRPDTPNTSPESPATPTTPGSKPPEISGNPVDPAPVEPSAPPAERSAPADQPATVVPTATSQRQPMITIDIPNLRFGIG